MVRDTFVVKLEKFFRLWYYYCVFPVALALLLFGCYGFVANPEDFMVQSVNCYGSSDCEVATSKTISFFGVGVGKEFVIPVVSEEEFLLRKAQYDRMDFSIVLSLLLTGLGVLFKYRFRLRRFMKSEG